MTVLFADLVGFTAMSEHLDPEQVKRLVDHAFERLVRDVTSFGGRVDKIVGDAIVALFGAPVAHEDDAERAVRAALRMQGTLAEYASESGAGIRMRIGVNTGEVLVGALRAGGDYTAMGDVVNTASRLQSLADPGEVLVGQSTRNATSSAISYESRGAIVPRGREQSVEVWTALAVLRPPGHRPRRWGSPFIGREHEMDVLTNALDVSVRNGRGQVVLVLGEAGVGKTRIASELAEVAALEHGASHFSGRCVPYGEANPWWPVAEVLRSGCGVGRDDPIELARERTAAVVAAVHDPTDASAVAPIVDGLLHLMGYEGPLRGLDGGRSRTEATQALIRFLEASVRHGPIMVRVSDLHWADRAVLDLIDDVADHLARHPFVFVATARPSLQERWTPRIGRFNSLVLNLDPLDRGSSALLLDALVGVELDAVTRATLLDRSGGNPFYIEELVTLVAERLLDGDRAGVVPADTLPDILPDTLPDTLRGIVAARIDGLGIEEQQVLEDAAVWGTSGPIEALNLIAAELRDVADVSRSVRALVDTDVLDLDGTEWSFRSNLVREVSYARLTKRERLLRHLGIAEFMERAMGDGRCDDATVETSARHLVVASQLATELGMSAARPDIAVRAVRWTGEAARRAEIDGSWRLAERLYSDALDLIDEEDLTPRFDILIGRSRVRAESWEERGALDDATAALAIAERIADPRSSARSRARALLRRATALARSGHIEQADTELKEAIGIFDDVGDLQGRADALRERGLASLLRSDTRRAEAPIAEALDAFRALGDRRGEAWSLQNLAWIALVDGRLDHADAFVADSEVAFRALGDPGGLAWAQGLAAFARLERGDLGAAADIAGRILRECERRGDRFGEAMMLTVLAHVELWRGHTTAAAASAEQAVSAFRSSPDLAGTVGLEQALSVAGRAEIMAGNPDRGLALLDEAITSALSTADGGSFASGVSLVTAVQVGRPDPLLDLPVERWLGAAGAARAPLHEATYALGLAQVGRVEEALAFARNALHGAPEHGYVLSVLALVSSSAGLVDEAVAAAEQLDQSPTATYLDRVWADIAVAVSDPGDRGRRYLEQAEVDLGVAEDVVAAGLLDLTRQIRRDRAAGRLDPRAVDTLSSDAGLSDSLWGAMLVAAADRAAV